MPYQLQQHECGLGRVDRAGGQELQEGFGSNNMLFVVDLLQLPSVNGINVLSWSGSVMYKWPAANEHFWRCLTNRRMEVFPLHQKWWIMPQPVKVENFPVYCHCCLSWDRNHAHDDMAMCTMCTDWFHKTCDNAESKSQSQLVGVQKMPKTVELALSNLCIVM